MKRYSTSLTIREMQIKITMRFSLHIYNRMVIIKKSTNDKCWWGCREKEALVYCWWECKLVQPLWKTVWKYLKRLKIEPRCAWWLVTLCCPSVSISRLFAWGDLSIGASASASVLPMNIQGWFPLGLTILTSLLSKRLSWVFSSTTVKHQFFDTQPSFWSNSLICTWLLEKP